MAGTGRRARRSGEQRPRLQRSGAARSVAPIRPQHPLYTRFGLGELKVSAPLAKRDKADYGDPAGDEHTQTALTQAGRSIEARLAWHF
ncbi:MAG: hypothetical protein KKG92_09505 [Gammaproteobacteria bacterium]|nr:hypothetical protein [Gammaproteobacteria bacterium]